MQQGARMALNETQRKQIETFRDSVETDVESEGIGSHPERADRPDDSALSSHFPVGPHLWYALTVKPFLPQFLVGIVTDDPFRNEDFQQLIRGTSLTMPEFVQLGFEAAGLVWRDPPVHHYRDRDNIFYFVTPVDLPSLTVLEEPSIMDKARRMMRGYHWAFSGRVA
jgi:hypothetical protein